jgi:hypothetical protein
VNEGEFGALENDSDLTDADETAGAAALKKKKKKKNR